MKDYTVPPRIKGPFVAQKKRNDRLERWALVDASDPGVGKEIVADNVRNEGTAHRLAACWNACDGTSTHYLEGFAQGVRIGGEPMDKLFDSLRAERDRLQSTLDKIYANAGESQEWIRAVIDGVKVADAGGVQ